MFHRQGDSSMCVLSLGWTLNWPSHLPAVVGGYERSQHVLCEELASYRQHHGRMTNSCPSYCWEGNGKPPSISLAQETRDRDRDTHILFRSCHWPLGGLSDQSLLCLVIQFGGLVRSRQGLPFAGSGGTIPLPLLNYCLLDCSK